MRTANKITGKLVNPGLVEHLNVKNVKNYIGCDQIVFSKLKTIHPFSIARLSVVPAAYISLGRCDTYEGIGKDLATLQVENLAIGSLSLNAKDVISLFQSKTVRNMELNIGFLTKLKEEEMEEVQTAFNEFKGKVEWNSGGSYDVSEIKFKSAKLLYSVDSSCRGVLSARAEYRTSDGGYERKTHLTKAISTYKATSIEVLTKALVLSSLLDMAEALPASYTDEEMESSRKVVLSLQITDEETKEETNKMLEALKLFDDLIGAREVFKRNDYSMFSRKEVLDTPDELLNTFFKNKKCALNLDVLIFGADIDQDTFESLTDRPIRKIEVSCEKIDATKFGKGFKLISTGDALLKLSEIVLKSPTAGEESPAHRLGEMIKMAVGICKDNKMSRPFEASIAENSEEITYESFMPIIEAINYINENNKAGNVKITLGGVKLFSIKIPEKCHINNKLSKTIKDFVKANRSSSRPDEQATHTGLAHDKTLIFEPSNRAYAMNIYA